jgi:outer membrane protein assembly factor BamB
MNAARLRLRDKLIIFDRAAVRKLGFSPSALVARRRIYVSRYNVTALRRPQDGEIVALDRQTLATEWRVKTDSLGAHIEWDEATLTLAGAHMGALDVASGRVLWTMYSMVGGHRWSDRLLLFERDRQALVGVNVHTGEKRLILTAPEQVAGSILCGDTLICAFRKDGQVGEQGLVRGFDLRTGDVMWERDLLAEARLGHGVDCTFLMEVSGSLPGRFVLVTGFRGPATLGCAVEDGRILWKADVPVHYHWPLVEGGRIPILTEEEFVVLDEATGEVLCRRKHGIVGILHARGPGSLVSEDVFGAVTEEGQVMLFDMHTAELLSWAQHRVSFQGTAAADGRFFVVGSDGKLWVYEPLGS